MKLEIDRKIDVLKMMVMGMSTLAEITDPSLVKSIPLNDA